MSYTLVFDTETTGFPKRLGFDRYYHPRETKYYDSARMIQFGGIIIDHEGKEISQREILIAPSGYTEINNSDIHGITYETAKTYGQNIDSALKEISEMIKKCHTIVAHNLLFDLNILSSEFYRSGYDTSVKLLETKNKKCTMNLGKKLFNMWKSPKLSELYKQLYPNEEFIQTHNALSDAKYCLDCYKILNSLQ